MEAGLTLNDIANTVHPFPTYAGLAHKLANQFVATRLERGFVRTALRWFYGFQPRDERTAEADGQSQNETEAVAPTEGHGH